MSSTEELIFSLVATCQALGLKSIMIPPSPEVKEYFKTTKYATSGIMKMGSGEVEGYDLGGFKIYLLK